MESVGAWALVVETGGERRRGREGGREEGSRNIVLTPSLKRVPARLIHARDHVYV